VEALQHCRTRKPESAQAGRKNATAKDVQKFFAISLNFRMENAAVVVAIVCAKGIGFVNFIDPESAQKAIRALNSFPFLDRAAGQWEPGGKCQKHWTLMDVCCV